MKILVTGSSGFVGSNLVRLLSENQIDVIGLDAIPSALDVRKCLSAEEVYRLGSERGDLTDLLSLADGIIHLAAGPKNSSAQMIQDTVMGTNELFEAASDCKNIQQIILLGSDKVGSHMIDKGRLFVESGQSFDCRTVYAAAKGAQELLAQAYIEERNLPVVIARSVNIFGPNQSLREFVPSVVVAGLEGTPVKIQGSGMQTRQWVCVKHVCQFLNTIATSNMIPPGTILHVTGTKGIQNITMAMAILSALGRKAKIEPGAPGIDSSCSMDRTEETDRFAIDSYDESNFISDLKETVDWYEKKFGGEKCQNLLTMSRP